MSKTGCSIYWWPDYGLCYMAVPKVMNTAIWHSIRNKLGPPERITKEQLREMDSRPFVFTFVRNPLDRAVSMWADKLTRMVNATPRILEHHSDMYVGMGFPDFLYALSNNDGMWNQHFQCQTDILGGVRIDCLESYESLGEAWERWQGMWWHHSPQSYDIEIDLSMENMSSRSYYLDYYTPATLKMCYALYRKDFVEYDYESVYRNALLSKSRDVGDSSRQR